MKVHAFFDSSIPFIFKAFMNLGTFKTFIELESILSFLRVDAWYEVNSIKENWNYI